VEEIFSGINTEESIFNDNEGHDQTQPRTPLTPLIARVAATAILPPMYLNSSVKFAV
jgi:hypothetical protein